MTPPQSQLPSFEFVRSLAGYSTHKELDRGPPMVQEEDSVNPITPCLQLSVGCIRCAFQQSTLFVRSVRRNGIEVVRAIYAAVRDRNWDTVPTRLENVDVEQTGERARIRFSAICENQLISYRYNANVEIRENELRFEFAGKADSDFLRNRIGLCVLHPIALCAGAECVVEHTDGRSEDRTFPRLVQPDQPLTDIRRLRYAVDTDTQVEVLFEGEIFEMEDQRNWTDSSFKTYGTPLSLPFPQQVRRGERLNQSVTVKFIESARKSRSLPERHTSSAKVLDVDFEQRRAKPAIGLGGDTTQVIWPQAVSRALRHLRCDHFRIDCRLSDLDWTHKLRLASGNARSIGGGLQVAVFLDNDAEQQLRALSNACMRAAAPVKLWIIFGRDSKCTPPRLVQLAQEVLRKSYPDVPFAAGTNAYFAELNRERPPAGADWHPCFSLNPQVHASDELSMIENLEAQGDVVQSAREFAKYPAVISPITLRPRFNPNATEPHPLSASADPRQSSLFAAAWTLGSIATLTREKNIHSISYFEASGSGGAMTSEGVLYPVYHVFAAVSELATLAEVSRVAVTDGMRSVIAGTTANGRKIVLVANHGAEEETVELHCAEQVRLRTLSEDAARDPQYWQNARETICDARKIALPAGGIVHIELL